MEARKLYAAVHRLVLALAVLAAILVLAPNVIRVPYRFSITYNEGWNLYHGARVAAGEVLYDPARRLIPVNYPPLYFYMEVALGKAADVLQAGRWISVASLLLLALFAGKAVRLLGGGWPDAFLSAALFAGYAGAYVPQYVGMNDPQLLAHVFVFGGFLILLRDPENRRRLVLASFLMACGLFVKHNLLAVPLAAIGGLLFQSRRRAAFFIAASAIFISILTLGTRWIAGSDFVHQILSPRTVNASKLLHDTQHLLTFMVLPFIVAVVWVKKHFSGHIPRYFALYLLFSLAVGITASSGFGTAGNMFLDAFLALAVIGGLFVSEQTSVSLARSSAAWLPPLLVAALAGNYVLDAPGNLRELINGTTMTHLQQREKIFLGDVAYLSQRPGPALCETLTLCFYAGKPMELDPFNVSQAIVTGAMQEQPVIDLIESGRFRTIQFKGQRMPVQPRSEHSATPELNPDTFFTMNTVAAIQGKYELKRKTQTGLFFTFAR